MLNFHNTYIYKHTYVIKGKSRFFGIPKISNPDYLCSEICQINALNDKISAKAYNFLILYVPSRFLCVNSKFRDWLIKHDNFEGYSLCICSHLHIFIYE